MNKILLLIVVLQSIALVYSHYRKSVFYVKRWAYRNGMLKATKPPWISLLMWEHMIAQLAKPRKIITRGKIARSGADNYFHKYGERG
jgi:hypothetical protein